MDKEELNSTRMVDNKLFEQSVQTARSTFEAVSVRDESLKLEGQVRACLKMTKIFFY